MHRKEPWLLHSLTVNTLNFCAFAMCKVSQPVMKDESSTEKDSILIAVPGLEEGFVNIIHLPSEERIHTVAPAKEAKGGMIMALRIFFQNDVLHLITGHESGTTTLQFFSSEQTWKTIYTNDAHTQPIISLDTSPKALETWYTSGADSIIGLHSVQLASPSPSLKNAQKEPGGETKTIQTKHSGQQSLTVRSDGKIFATAGWDARIRVYSAKTMKEVAILKWHKEGCYAVAFADILSSEFTDSGTEADVTGSGNSKETQLVRNNDGEGSVTRRTERTVKQRREDKARETHWLAAGSKDGKVSLWEIY
jgi:WD40 repeat protein